MWCSVSVPLLESLESETQIVAIPNTQIATAAAMLITRCTFHSVMTAGSTTTLSRRELWTTLLGYNLIRTTAAGAALLHDKQPRQISFTSTCQYVLASWMLTSCGLMDKIKVEDYCLKLLEQIAECEVANRPGRLEPRVLKLSPGASNKATDGRLKRGHFV